MAANSTIGMSKCFDDLHGDYWKGELTVRLIHSWEAQNIRNGNTLLGVEVLLIDSKGVISSNRLYRFQGRLKPGTNYKLSNFIIRPAKRVFKVTAHPLGIIYTDQTSFVEQEGDMVDIPTQKFRIHNFQAFEKIADTATDLYGKYHWPYPCRHWGNLEAVTTLSTPPPAGGRTEERVFLHVQLEDGETVRVYLWGGIAAAFRRRWNGREEKPTVVLITTMNPKTLGSVVALSSTAATRLFFDMDVDATSSYMARFANGDQTIPRVGSATSAITKLEAVSLDEIHSFLATETPQVATFMCYATITDVLGEYGWFFVACSGCKSKMARTTTTLQCENPKCTKETKLGLIRFRVEARVRDESGGVGTFDFFDTEVEKFIGRKAPDLMNEIRHDSHTLLHDHEPVPAPVCLENMVGHSHKFQVKVDDFTFRAARKTITVSRIVKDEPSDVKGAVEEDQGTVACKERDGPTSGSEIDHVEDPGTGETAKKDGKRPRYN